MSLPHVISPFVNSAELLQYFNSVHELCFKFDSMVRCVDAGLSAGVDENDSFSWFDFSIKYHLPDGIKGFSRVAGIQNNSLFLCS